MPGKSRLIALSWGYALTCRACRVCRAVLVPTWRTTKKQVVLASTSLVFCALNLHQSQEQVLEKKWGWHVHPSPRCGDACEHVSCELHLSRMLRLSWRASRRAARQARHSQWRQRLGDFGGWIDAKGKVTWGTEVAQLGPGAKTQ